MDTSDGQKSRAGVVSHSLFDTLFDFLQLPAIIDNFVHHEAFDKLVRHHRSPHHVHIHAIS